jgi:hypothetical protein
VQVTPKILAWSVAATLLLAAGASSHLSASPPSGIPSGIAKVGEAVKNLGASHVGVDRAGNLWVYSWNSGRIDLFSPAGERIATANVGSGFVDADRSWGVAVISAQGAGLRVVPWQGAPSAPVPLENRSNAVAWVGPETVAVAPALAGHRAEIWNLRDKVLAKTLGAERPLSLGPGIIRERTLELRYDGMRDLLHTLDSFTGDLQIFSMDGRLVRREAIPEGDHSSLDRWLSEIDQKARAENRSDSVTLRRFRLSLDAGGTVWVIQHQDEERGQASVVKVPPGAKAETLVIEERSPSLSHAVWNGSILIYSQTGDPTGPCFDVRRLP